MATVILGVVLVGAIGAEKEDVDPLVGWLQQQRLEVTAKLAGLREQAVKNEKNLADIRSRHNQALEKGDRKAAETYALAIVTWREAQDRNAAAQAAEGGRLDALTRAGEWRTMPRLQATAADLVPAGGPAGSPPRNSFGVAGVVRGDVQIKTAQGWAKYDPTRPILPGDEVKTGPHSYAEVLFTDGSRMRIDENSSFHLDRLDEQNSVFDKITGRIHAVISCLKDKRKSLSEALMTNRPCIQNFHPSGGAPGAVRGTEFVMEVGAEGRQLVMVFEGSYEVQIANSEKPLAVLAGERAIVTADGRVESHGRFEPGKVQRWWRNAP